MNEELEIEIRSFLQSMAGACSNCLRRNQGYCADCYAGRAKRILQRMSIPTTQQADICCDIVARMARIAAIMQRIGRPVKSEEINMKDYCSRSLKEFTLREMIRLGRITRKKIPGSQKYLYALRPQRKGQHT